MGAAGRPRDTDQHHAVVAFGIGEQCVSVVDGAVEHPGAARPHEGHLPAYESAGSLITDRVAARQVGRNMTETLKNLKRMVEP